MAVNSGTTDHISLAPDGPVDRVGEVFQGHIYPLLLLVLYHLCEPRLLRSTFTAFLAPVGLLNRAVLNQNICLAKQLCVGVFQANAHLKKPTQLSHTSHRQ
jgi:hypothetical protein